MYPKRKPKKERIEAICQAIEEGNISSKEIAEVVGLAPVTVKAYAKQAKISLHLKKRGISEKGLEERKEKVRNAIEGGALSISKIARGAGIPYSTARILANEICPTKERRAVVINKALVDGANSIQDLSERVNMSPGSIVRYAKERYITLPSDWNLDNLYNININSLRKSAPDLESMIREGRAEAEIGKILNVSSESIRQKIHALGLYNKWKNERKRQKEDRQRAKQGKLEEIQKLTSVLEQRVKQLVYGEGWAYEKAWEFFSSLKIYKQDQSYSFDRIVELFNRYDAARKKEKTLSLKELGVGIEIPPTSIGRILRVVGIDPMYRKIERECTPKETKEALARGLSIDMTASDLAYFLDIPFYTVADVRRRHKIKVKANKPIKRFGFRNKVLTYRLASQIYEAEDLGFNTEEIRELFDTREDIVNHALRYRTPIGNTIIRTLKELYPNKIINQPYKALKKQSL